MRPFEPTTPIYHKPEPGDPPRRIHACTGHIDYKLRRRQPPLLLVAVLLVSICATLVILST
jgi:hypothetical protein